MSDTLVAEALHSSLRLSITPWILIGRILQLRLASHRVQNPYTRHRQGLQTAVAESFRCSV